jgi:hypothetical protein
MLFELDSGEKHQNLMNQTNIIERNNLERVQGQKIAVVTSGGLMRNSEPQNLYSLVSPTDDQAGAMTSFSPESSSNNISTGNEPPLVTTAIFWP